MGDGLDQALAGAEAVVDVTNAGNPALAREFFGMATERLLAAERRRRKASRGPVHSRRGSRRERQSLRRQKTSGGARRNQPGPVDHPSRHPVS